MSRQTTATHCLEAAAAPDAATMAPRGVAGDERALAYVFLAANLFAAGEATTEKVWRMPLGPEYDKMIDSKTADMKNIGGRWGGAVTAAQFLQRFVGDTPWVHLDIAGTAMGSPQTEINKSWSSGFGVRLLDRLVRDHYE